MNTIQLECFVAVAEHLNFSKASQALKITQPAVSHQVQTLEEELGVKLFARNSRNVTLTPEGILFLSDAELILKTAHSAKERLGKHDHFLPFDLGCHNHTELNLLPAALQKLSEEFPLLRPSMRLVPFPSLLSLVENNQILAALSIKETQKKLPLSFRELCLAPIACICSPEHPLAQYKTLTLSRLSGNFIACSPRQTSSSVFAVHSQILTKLPPEQHYLTENIESAFTLAKAQIGYTLYPDIPLAREAGLCYIPVTDLPKVPFGVYFQYHHDHPALKRFLSIMPRLLQES